MGGKGTDRRAAKLPAEYRRKLAVLDRKFNGVREGEVGPFVRKLESIGKLEGLAVGPWGEASKDLHSLVKVLG